MQAKCENGGASNANIQKKQPVSDEIMQSARNLASKAHNLAELVDSKLAPVMSRARLPSDDDQDNVVIEYPPLFSDLRDSLRSIDVALENIGHAMSRTEL